MKTKHKKSRNKSKLPKSKVLIRNYEETPQKYRSKMDPLDLEEHKHEFLHHGHVSKFQFKTDFENMQDTPCIKQGVIKCDLLAEASRILENVNEKFGCGDQYIEQTYGTRINAEEASSLLVKYLEDTGSEGMMTISWSKDLSCSGQMSWRGPCLRYNKPEARKYSMWIKNSEDNVYLREHGIHCLANHEIATHFYRSLNDGLQPWFSNRQRFGLSGLNSQTLAETEEGLASINTVLQAKNKYLFSQALTYYTACKATEMTFHELFDHLGQYLMDKELRWKYVMRVKRCLQDPGGVGGNGKDQCYFTGAVDILRNIDNTDFHLLYSGKISREEIPRIKRMARLDFIKLPAFLQNQETYRKQLRHMAILNGLIEHRPIKTSSKLVNRRKFDRLQQIKIPQPLSSCSQSVNELDINLNSSRETHCGSHCTPVEQMAACHVTKRNPKCVKKDGCSVKKKQPQTVESTSMSESDSHSIVRMIYVSRDEACNDDEKVTPTQAFCSWWSSRSPSPVAGSVATDDRVKPAASVSPVPYSPHRWLLRKRNRSSPNVLIKKNEATYARTQFTHNL
ncbi:uncharacterized protein KIAA0895-like [Patiria miniata]|uniref:Uncharacterized protein n=1 Tax=Patiria miniata TaxID=46514 RepID=A0A913ZE55_PATMI|nr:uncharacterized protein KIAA0895-like [Patiria miniata]XP_038049336.1 uncharacterized protein KIAA0895-like [Patiria miniata]XP_038049337.1 uncharacterized protein KIAA0895-like [Patiria miniata]